MKFIFYLIIVMSLLSCNMDENLDINSPPVRPENIPNTAFWQGGKDGGFWYECISTTNQFEFKCSVCNDFTGDLIIKDKFSLYIYKNNSKIPLSEFVEKNKFTANDINSFDGYDEIYLKGGLILKSSK